MTFCTRYPITHLPKSVHTKHKKTEDIASIIHLLFELNTPTGWIDQLGRPQHDRKYCTGMKYVKQFETVWSLLRAKDMHVFIRLLSAKFQGIHHQHIQRLSPIIHALHRLGVSLGDIWINCGEYVGNLLHFMCSRRWGFDDVLLDHSCIRILLKHVDINHLTTSQQSCLDIILNKVSFQCLQNCPRMFCHYLREFQEDSDLIVLLIQHGHVVSDTVYMKLYYLRK